MRMINVLVAALCGLLLAPVAAAQSYLMVPDSTNNRVMLFDPFDGSLVNVNYFNLNAGTTPVHAMQVNNEIWVSTQLGDRIERYTLSGTPISNITGAMDNLRGMELVGNTVYLCNDGTGNGAPGSSLIQFDTSGNNLGSFPTPSSSPFGILANQGSLLVSSDVANDDIHRYSLTGTPMGTFHNSTSLNFAEQMNYATNGDILVAGFSSNNVVRLDGTGAIVGSFSASGARGVHQLGNGNIMWTSGAGVSVFNVTSGTSTLIQAGGGRFIDLLVIPSPGACGLLGLALLTGKPRRRRA